MTKARLMERLMLLMLALCLTAACSDKNEDEPAGPDNPSGPTTPTGDEFTVAATGGTVEKGDIAITYPSGTFTGETKVYVKEVTKGETLGEDEVSTFYQVTMPALTDKSFTIRTKCTNNSNDLVFVLHAPVAPAHNGGIEYADIYVEPTLDGDYYKAELPHFENPIDTQVDFTIGLAHALQIDADGNEMSLAASSRSTEETSTTRAYNRVGNIIWHHEFPKGFDRQKNQEAISYLNQYIKEALTKLDAIGMKLKDDLPRNIPFKYNPRVTGDYGEFKKSAISDLFGFVEINSNMFTGTIDHEELSRTIMHELHHYFANEYDKRWQLMKAGRGIWGMKSTGVGSYWLMLMEAGGVWAEKFMGSSDASALMKGNVRTFSRGYYYEDLVAGGIYTEGENKTWQAHGYGMSLLFEKFSQDHGDKSISELYEFQRDGASTPYDCIDKYVKKHSPSFFSGTDYHSFLQDAALGLLKSGISYGNMRESLYSFSSDKSNVFSGECFRHGTFINVITIGDQYRNAEGKRSLKGKQLTFKEANADVTTYVFMLSAGSNKGTYNSDFIGMVTKQESLVIKETKALDKLIASGGENSGRSTIILMTEKDFSTDAKPSPTELTVTLSDADKIELIPDELSFDGKAGSQTVTADTNFDELDLKPSASWMSATFDKTAKQITVSVETNTGDKREGTIIVKGGELTATIKVTQQAGTGNLWKLVKTTVDSSGAHRENSWTSDVTGGNGSYSYKSTWMDGPRQWSGLDHDDCTGESISSTLSHDQLKDSYKPGEAIKLSVSWTYTDCANHPFNAGPMTIAFQYVYNSTGSSGWFTDENGKDTCPYINSINGTGGASNGGFPASGSGYLASPSLRTGSAGQKLEIRMSLGNIWPSYKAVYEYEWIP